MEVFPGQELPRMTRTPTSRQLVRYAAVSGELSEIHYDLRRAATLGVDRVVVHGGLKAAWITQLLLEWAGPTAALRRLDLTYRGMDLVDDKYTLGATVTDVNDTGDVRLVSLEVWGEMEAEHRRTTEGRAVMEMNR